MCYQRCPKTVNSNLFVGKRSTVHIKSFIGTVDFIGAVARFSRSKSLLINFGAPVVLHSLNDQFIFRTSEAFKNRMKDEYSAVQM